MTWFPASVPDHPDPNLGGWHTVLNMNPGAKNVTGAYTATSLDFGIYCNATGGAFTVTLPPAADNKGKLLFIKRTSASNNVTIDWNGSETIDGSATVTLSAQHASRLIQSDGTNWRILASV